MKILVTGGQGYKGSVLIPKLLDKGYEVISFDIGWFGDHLPNHQNLVKVVGDLRDTDTVPIDNVNCIIHLASIANDPCSDLNPKLTWETSCLATMMLIEKASRNGVSQFIYASSGSVYGVNDAENITENLNLNPISEYNKTKMVSERVLLSYKDKMSIQIIRPATVCGYSPRTRLDVSVNLLTAQAILKNSITVLGGSQTRPNIHIKDICNVYLHFLERPKLTGIFNAGFENLSIMEIANKIKLKTGAEIIVEPSNDPRSYRINSDKLLKTGYLPKYNVDYAIDELLINFQNGKLKDEPHLYNLKWMIKNDYSKV